jgi:hypothetical protein
MVSQAEDLEPDLICQDDLLDRSCALRHYAALWTAEVGLAE